jgi:NAD(P)-dependent dehydrogenase (short-subunit alcohol dehydrogenase family)
MTSNGRLQGRVAIVTGSSSGLGAAIAMAFASEGAKLFCVDLYPAPRNKLNPTTQKADDLSNRLSTGQGTHERIRQLLPGTDAAFHKADITQSREVEMMVRACVSKYGRVDILVNSAGIAVESQHSRPLRAHETSEEDFERTWAVNCKGIFLCCKYVLKQMLEGQEKRYGSRGWIINIASILGLVTFPCTPSYSASKGGVVQLTKQIALDYAQDEIQVNAICPGFLDTAMTQNLQSDEGALAAVTGAHPYGGQQGKLGKVEDVARNAVFLASEDAKWVTGVAMPVDGGYVVR